MSALPLRRYAVALVVAVLSPAAIAQTSDYLEPDLRARVENLKAEVVARPADIEAARQRADTLWDWANAYAMTGGYLPVNLSTAVHRNNAVRPAGMVAINAYIRELALVDEDPGALGQLTAETGPFEARSWATFTQTWRVGSAAVVPGGGVVVPRHFLANHGTLQADAPGGDHHVSIASSNAAARFVPDAMPVSGMHGGFRAPAPMLFFRLTEGALRPGDTVTVTYGDRSGGGRGLLMPTFSSDRMPFPLYVVLDSGWQLFSLPIQHIRVTGTTLAGVRGFAPSVVRPGETFDLAVRAEDAFRNRAQGPYPAWRIYANGAPVGELAAGDDPIVVLGDLRFDAPGVYRFEIRSADGAVAGGANPVLVSSDATRVFWGDTHGHSGFAEGIGTPERFMAWAKEDARLDYVTHSEHDIWMDDFEWEVLKRNVADHSEAGRFVGFLGYEWTSANVYGGHHNVLFRTPEGRRRVSAQFFPELSDLYAGLRRHHDPADVVVIPHAHNTGNYRMGDPKLQPIVEIMSQHGTFEWFGRAYLAHGHQVGFTAASDNHLSQPGYTAPRGDGLAQRGGLGAVLAEEHSRDAIFDGLKAARAYATTGDRILLDVTVNEGVMGQRILFTPERRIRGRVIGTAGIETVTVVKNGEEVLRRDYSGAGVGRPGSAETLHLTFESTSVPVPGDNPRGWRHWSGTLEATGARIVAATPTDFFNPDLQRLQLDDAGTVRFATITRGDASSIRLTLDDISRNARLRLVLEERRETGAAPPIYRPPATLPGATLEFPLEALGDGAVRRTLPVDTYEDTVTLRLLATDGPRDVTFEFDDTGTQQGDYYYVRVKQVDDAMAWSSPVWVGGHPNR